MLGGLLDDLIILTVLVKNHQIQNMTITSLIIDRNLKCLNETLCSV